MAGKSGGGPSGINTNANGEPRGDRKIYSATYSNVPVFEYNIAGNHVMRRRADDWINATHILKVADYDKPARTRILEREVQKGVHEKVQGGYGKYQGTWIPLPDGRDLAAKNGVLDRLMPIFNYVPGDRSPPPAPKHATAASSKPRLPRAAPQRRPVPPAVAATSEFKPKPVNKQKGTGRGQATATAYSHATDYDRMDGGDTPDNDTVASESILDDYEAPPYNTSHSRKKRRVEDTLSQADREHQLWAEELLNYFMLQDDPLDALPSAPVPPANANLNRPIDERGYTALHWAAAMGDVDVVKDLLRRGASIDVQSQSGETPLMRAVIFTNSFDRRNMEKLAALLIRTVNMQEWRGSTAFHHIAGITQSKKKYECARYYLDCILNKMAEVLSPDAIERILNERDNNGDTAVTIAARNGARKCVRSLIGRNAAVDIPNQSGETADQLIVQLNHRRQERTLGARQLSSSPFQADNTLSNSYASGVQHQPLVNGHSQALPFSSPPNNMNGNATSSATLNDVHTSSAALTLTSQIMPVLFTKAKSLAHALDAELAEKDAELAEAERVAALRRKELEALKRQAEELRQRESDQLAALSLLDGTVAEAGEVQGQVTRESVDERLVRELERLEQECEGLTEAQQAQALQKLLEQEEQGQHDTARPSLIAANEHSTPQHQLSAANVQREKLLLARELSSLARERRVLVKEIVLAIGAAGLGDRQDEYRRLIAGALGVKVQDVQGVLPEILGELEEGWGVI